MTSKCTNPGLCHKNFGITRFNTIELMLGTDFANLELSNEMSLSLARVVCLIYLLVASNFRMLYFEPDHKIIDWLNLKYSLRVLISK